MVPSAPPSLLSALIPSLQRNTQEIDQTFAAVGEMLGRGLAVFATLNDRFAAMSDELAGADMEATHAALVAVVADLHSFGRGLLDETRGLQDVARYTDDARRSLAQLTGRIGFIAEVARIARIEAARLPSAQQGGGFFAEIGSMVAHARTTVEACARDHGRLQTLLASAVGFQRHFATAYGAELTQDAAGLERSLAQVALRRRGSATATGEVSLKSRAIADAISNAIVALQCGDSTRQRLEHSLAVLCHARAMEGGTHDPALAELDEADRAALQAVLQRLAASQLRATAATMTHDVREIDDALRILSADAAATGSIGHTLYGNPEHGDANPGSTSFLVALEAELARASALIGKCNAARAEVNGVMDRLAELTDQFRRNSASLSETIGNIAIIGINAGLHAARLGNGGRVLVVIAQELKSIADQIVDDAARLSPIFHRMQDATGRMKQQHAGGEGRLASLDAAMRQSLQRMKGSMVRLNDTLEGLATDSHAFAAAIEAGRRSFLATVAAGQAITDAVHALGDAPCAPDADPAVLERFLAASIWPSYTMAAERQIHRDILVALGLPDIVPIPAEEENMEAMFF